MAGATVAPSPAQPHPSRVVAFTTPPSYAPRLARLLRLRGWSPLPCPSVLVGPTLRTAASLKPYFRPAPDDAPPLLTFSAIAFTSRNGISAISDVLGAEPGSPPLPAAGEGEPFTVTALGKDAELLTDEFLSSLCADPSRIQVLLPRVATPAGMVESLGPGSGRRILCPIPLILDPEEPPVVPEFLAELASNGWEPVRVLAYETRWAGPASAETLLRSVEEGGVDAIVFTSTAEVEGLLKGLGSLGFEWGELRTRWPGLVAAAHGPVTAAGAARLGVKVDVVGEKFASFEGVVEALARRWGV